MSDIFLKNSRGHHAISLLHLIVNAHSKYKIALKILAPVVALVLGFVGYTRQSLQKGPVQIDVVVDNWYKALQLLTAQMPRNYEIDLPWELQIARFAVPITAVWLSVGIYLAYVRKPLHLIKVARASDHVVVIGPSARAEEIARQCADDDEPVVCVLDHDKEALAAKLQSAGVPSILGDPGDAGTYRRVRLNWAGSVVVATGDTVRNINISAAIRAFILADRPDDRPPLTLVVEIEGSDLRGVLEASFRRSRERRIECRVFDGADNVARSLLPRLAPLVARSGPARTILLVGLDNVGEAVLFKLIRNCPEGTRFVVALTQAADARAALTARHPFLEALEFVEFVEAQPGPALMAGEDLPRRLGEVKLGAVIVAATSNGGGSDVNERNLTSAIALRRFAAQRGLATPPIFVRQTGGSEVLDALKLVRGENIDTSRIHPFGGLDEECAPDNVLRGRLDALARRIHEDYCQSAPPGPATAPWDALDETFRTASRNQADHVVFKLAYARCRALPARRDPVELAFTDVEVEALARLEHWRWWMDRTLDGWTLGPVKDVNARTHPDMVPYDQLSEAVKAFDRAPARELPALLGSADRTLAREHRIAVTPGADPDRDVRAIRKRIKAAREDGHFPIVVLGLADEAGLSLARRLAKQKVPFEVKLTGPVPALPVTVDRDELMGVLDEADDVDLVEGSLEEALAGADATFCGPEGPDERDPDPLDSERAGVGLAT